MKISGTFNANLNAIDGYAKGENGVKLSRMSIEKTWNRDLDAKAEAKW